MVWVTVGCKKTPKISAQVAAALAAKPRMRNFQPAFFRPRYKKKEAASSSRTRTMETTMLVWMWIPAAEATPAASDTCVRSHGRKGSPRNCKV